MMLNLTVKIFLKLVIVSVFLLFSNTVTSFAIDTHELLRESSGGDQYKMTCDLSGYTLASVQPISRILSYSKKTPVVNEQEIVHLNRNCAAYSKYLGAGKWCWANGGFVIELAESRIGFPRQELVCQGDNNLGINCRC